MGGQGLGGLERRRVEGRWRKSSSFLLCALRSAHPPPPNPHPATPTRRQRRHHLLGGPAGRAVHRAAAGGVCGALPLGRRLFRALRLPPRVRRQRPQAGRRPGPQVQDVKRRAAGGGGGGAPAAAGSQRPAAADGGEKKKTHAHSSTQLGARAFSAAAARGGHSSFSLAIAAASST